MKLRRVLTLAAGRGSRLSGMTAERPKCLLPFQGRSLIDWQMVALERVGISEFNIVRGYRGELLDALPATFWHNPDWQTTNMVYSLFCARGLLERRAPLLLSYGDIVYEPRVLRQALATQGDIVVPVNSSWRQLWQARMEDPLQDVETLKISPAGTLTDIGRKARSLDEIDGQYMGIISLTESGLETLVKFYDDAPDAAAWMMGRTKRNCHMTDLLRGLIQSGIAVTAARVDGGWLEFDTVDDVRCYEALAAESRLTAYFDSGPGGGW